MKKSNSQESIVYGYPVNTVTVTTCDILYQKWSTRKRLYARNTTGLTMDIEYADTLPLCTSSDRPTILALHGAPGSHVDFKPFIEYFASKNVRIIVPTYPDFNLTIETKVFRHSADEKFVLIADFLSAIGVNKIDLLIAHSSAIYPAVRLMLYDKLSIKSIAFFNPAGHRRIQAMRPAWFTEGSVKVYQNKWGRLLFKVFGKSFIKATNSVTVRPESMNNVMLSAQTMRYSNYKELDKYLIKLKEMNIPTMWAFSENDRLVEKEIFFEMIDIMGAKECNIKRYDDEGNPTSEYAPNEKIRVLVFKTGGHYAFLKHVDEMVNECDTFLQSTLALTKLGAKSHRPSLAQQNIPIQA